MRKQVTAYFHKTARRKPVLFLLLFPAALIVFIRANPVYTETDVFIFPTGAAAGQKIYYATSAGYSDYFSFAISDRAHTASAENLHLAGPLRAACADGGCARADIRLAEGYSFAEVPGDVVEFETPDGPQTLRLPARGLNMLAVLENGRASLYFSDIRFRYEKLMGKNRAVASAFPFYLAYRSTGEGAATRFDRAVPDPEVYDTSLDEALRPQLKTEKSFLDAGAPHYRALEFKRETESWHSQYAARFMVAAAFLFCLFVLTVPASLWKTWRTAGRDRPLFLLLSLYLAVWFFIGHSSIYEPWDGVLPHVMRQEFAPHWSRLYMCLEYIFYITGYWSRSLCALLATCACVWNLNAIAARFFCSKALAAFRYSVMALLLLSPNLVLATLHSQRMYMAVLCAALGLIWLVRSGLLGERKYFYLSAAALFVMVNLRADFIFLALPAFIVSLFSRPTVARAVKLTACGVLLALYAAHIPNGDRGNYYTLLTTSFMARPVIAKHHALLTPREKGAVADVFAGGPDFFRDPAYTDWAVRHPGARDLNGPLSDEKTRTFNKTVLHLILKYPGAFFEHRLYILESLSNFQRPWSEPYPYASPRRIRHIDNLFAELDHSRLHKRVFDCYQNLALALGAAFCPIFLILPFYIVNALLFRYTPITGAISFSLLLYYGFLALAAQSGTPFYFKIFIIWFYFAPTLFVAEALKSARMKTSAAKTLRRLCLAGLALLLVLSLGGPETAPDDSFGGGYGFIAPLNNQPVSIGYPFYWKFLSPNTRVRIRSGDGGNFTGGTVKVEAQSLFGRQRPSKREAPGNRPPGGRPVWKTLEERPLPAGAARLDIRRYQLGLYGRVRFSLNSPGAPPGRFAVIEVVPHSFRRQYAAALAVLCLFAALCLWKNGQGEGGAMTAARK